MKEIKRGYVSCIWPHFNLRVIILFFQDKADGLKFENRGKLGSFDRVKCNDFNEMVVDVSKTLDAGPIALCVMVFTG